MVVTDLSMHKRHEQMLAEEQLSRNIIRQSVNAIIVCDERGFVIRANKAAADLIGSSCLNLPFNDVFHISMQDPAEEEKCPAARETPGQGELLKIEHIIAGRTYYSCEASIHRQNDEVEHLSLSASPMADDAGQVIGAVINIADISLQKRTEQVLREQNDYIQTILDNLPIGLAVSYLEDGTATYINKRFEEIYGWPAEELRNTEMFYEKVYPDPAYRQYMKSRIEADRASGDLERMYWKNVEITRKDGSRRIVSAKNIPIFDQNFMISTVQDDTQQAAAERKLEENEEKYRLIAENTVDCIWILDMDFNFTFVNQAVQTMFGYTPEEFVQTNLRDHCSEEAFRQLQKLVEEKSSGVPGGRAEPGKAELVFEANLRSRSGQSVSVEMHGAVIFDADGRASALQCVTRDVRERNSLEQRLRQAQKMEAVGRLAGGVAHDYNNMLSVILGYTEMAMDQLAKDDPLYGDLNEVLSAANRSRDITRQLLAFARKQTIAPVVLDLNKTISGMLNMVQRLIGEDIALEWHPGEELPPINMDPSQIDQLMVNLCINSRDAIEGVGRITITTGRRHFEESAHADIVGSRPGDYVLLSVSDSGCGMDEETRDNIFEPFYTTKGALNGRNQGTGLGLATVYGIVSQNEGFIGVESKPGEGTTFRLYLPVYTGTLQAAAEEEEAAVPRGSGETILLVEDDRANMQMTTIMLKKLGYQVLSANSPRDAFSTAEKEGRRIRMLLTDVIMPEMNGRDLAESITGTYPEIRVMFMSGYTSDVIAHHGVLDEGMHFIQKPFSMKELAVKVQETIGRC
jgi:two-component system, cell cycle sensor histidine kinase and response regulator CckA